MMQEARRFAEEVIEENFEVPDGIDCEGDAYLDDYDWDILAQVIIDDRVSPLMVTSFTRMVTTRR
jgi:hypothetical protein